MTLAELTDIICYELKRPTDSDLRIIVQKLIITSRANLIKQKFEATGDYPQTAILSTCFTTEKVASTLCCGVDLGCYVLRTTVDVPKPIEIIQSETNFLFVGGIDIIKGKSFGYIRPEAVKYIKNRKFTSKNVFYTYLNNRIIIFNNSNALEKLTIRYVPANPLELAALSDCSGKPCFDLDDSTFLEDHWEDAITKFIIPKLSQTKEEQIPIN